MANRIGFNLSPARVCEYESGIREPSLVVLLRYSEIAGLHMEVLANDNLKLPK
jgi:hypothetical protein